MSSDRVTMDARRVASATTKIRESMMAHILNGMGGPQSRSYFPCPASTLETFPDVFRSKYPEAGHTRVIGGLGKHYDLHTVNEGARLQTELKVTNGNPSPLEQLSWRPWQDTVQFLQGQLKSKLGKRFLGECGDPMVRAWFEEHVKPFSAAVPAATDMTYAGYEKAMSIIGMKGKQEPAAVAFINALRANEALQKALQEKWLAFETRWFTSHSMDHAALKEVVKEILEAKDAWICISKAGPQLIGGLKVVDLRFVGARPKPKGGMSFHYILTLIRDDVTKEVPMECKFHWKNGGQAVQNLNFMLL